MAELKAAARGSGRGLPDGNIIAVGCERFRCPEVLFRPSLVGEEAGGVADATFGSIITDVRRTLFDGTSMLLGIREQLSGELGDLPPSCRSSTRRAATGSPRGSTS